MPRTCQHIKVNGGRCGSPALRGRDRCYFHFDMAERLRRRAANPKILMPLPVLEDENSVQVALMDVMAAILENRIDPRRAGLLLWGLQIAAANCRRVRFRVYSSDETVRELPDVSATESPASSVSSSCSASSASNASPETGDEPQRPELPREIEADLAAARRGDFRAVDRLFTFAGLTDKRPPRHYPRAKQKAAGSSGLS